MRHCKNCENCIKDLVSLYIHGIEFQKCMIDNHHIVEPFREGMVCPSYKKKSKETKLF